MSYKNGSIGVEGGTAMPPMETLFNGIASRISREIDLVALDVLKDVYKRGWSIPNFLLKNHYIQLDKIGGLLKDRGIDPSKLNVPPILKRVKELGRVLYKDYDVFT